MTSRDFCRNHFHGAHDLERLAQSDPTLWALHLSESHTLGPSVLGYVFFSNCELERIFF